MKHLKGLQRTAILSAAIATLAFGGHQAKAAAPSGVFAPTPAGSCVGSAGVDDCVTAVGHISASVVGTLTINETRAVSFGNFAVASHGGGGIITMSDTGVRTVSGAGPDVPVLLYGANATGGGGAVPSGGQSPGHYLVTLGGEDPAGTSEVYISFADGAGLPIDVGGDSYYPNNHVVLNAATGPGTFFVDQFTFNEAGHDVYGHYIAAAGSAGATTVDVIVGARLTTTVAGAYSPGKYTGTYNVMVSY